MSAPTDEQQPIEQLLPTDEEMRARLGGAAEYTVVILRRTAAYHAQDPSPVVWEHGRRNFALRAQGKLPIVCPIRDDTDVCGLGIFAVPPDEVTELMAGDPGVQAGIFTFEVHPCRGFPGSALPGGPSPADLAG